MRKIFAVTYVSDTHSYHNMYAFGNKIDAIIEVKRLLAEDDSLHLWDKEPWVGRFADYISDDDDNNFRIMCHELTDVNEDGCFIVDDRIIIKN